MTTKKSLESALMCRIQLLQIRDLMKFLDTDDAWIRERTGICERRVSKDMGTCGLAIEAAKRAIDDAGIDPKEIDLIVLATSSGDRAFPAAAMDVQAAIGAVNAVGFDITAACSGFILRPSHCPQLFRSRNL